MSNNSFFNSIDIVQVVIRWRKHLLIVGLIALGASVLFSSPFFIPPRYKSFALVYPSNLIAYSKESPTEQMLQIAQSTDIRNEVIAAFDLYKHYGIDTLKNKHFRTEAIKMYEDNVSIKKTEFESMEITVYDTDPAFASQMVDSIIHYFDLKARDLQASKSREVLVITYDQMERKRIEMDSMEAVLKSYRRDYGILDYKSQSEEALRGYFRTLAAGNSRGASEAQNMLNALKEKGGEYNATNEHLWRIRGNYNELKIAYENAYRDVYKKLTYANVVTRPQPADKKSYPIRWLIVLVSVGSSLLLAFLYLLIIDTRQKISSTNNG